MLFRPASELRVLVAQRVSTDNSATKQGKLPESVFSKDLTTTTTTTRNNASAEMKKDRTLFKIPLLVGDGKQLLLA